MHESFSDEIDSHLNASPNSDFNFIYAKEDDSPENISLALRGTKTLVVDKNNTFDSTSVKAIFAVKGAWIMPKRKGQHTYERYRLLYLLARSYNLYAEAQLQQVSNAYDSQDLSRMIKHREAVLAFDLKCFFINPVILERHELRQAWPLLAEVYDVPQIHDEMKSQVQDLSDLIVAKQQAIQTKRYQRVEVFFGFLVQ